MQNLTKLQQHMRTRYGQARNVARYLGYDVKEYRAALGMARYYLEDWKGDFAYGVPDFNRAVTIDQVMEWLDERAADLLAELEQPSAA